MFKQISCLILLVPHLLSGIKPAYDEAWLLSMKWVYPRIPKQRDFKDPGEESLEEAILAYFQGWKSLEELGEPGRSYFGQLWRNQGTTWPFSRFWGSVEGILGLFYWISGAILCHLAVSHLLLQALWFEMKISNLQQV